jgi:hypothetical protein
LSARRSAPGFCIFAFDVFDKTFKIVKPRDCRLAALKREIYAVAADKPAKCAVYCRLHDLARHYAAAFDLAQAAYVGVKAIFTPQIAKRRRGLYHDCHIFNA